MTSPTDAASGTPDIDPAELPHGDEPGASSTPYADGEGTVGVADRLDGGAPDTNQGKAEPMPPTSDHPQPGADDAPAPPPPALGDMGAGRAPSQVASPAALGSDAAAGGGGTGNAHSVPVVSDVPADGTSQEQSAVDGVPAPHG